MKRMSKRQEAPSVRMKLFVYGSLRMGLYNYELYLKGKSRFLGYGYVIGELYSLKERSYPALLLGNSRILGEIYEVDEAAARAVDALEEYVPGSSENEYEKINTQILDEQGRQLDILPVYWYHVEKPGNRELLDEIIQEHDFTAYCKAKAS